MLLACGTLGRAGISVFKFTRWLTQVEKHSSICDNDDFVWHIFLDVQTCSAEIIGAQSHHRVMGCHNLIPCNFYTNSIILCIYAPGAAMQSIDYIMLKCEISEELLLRTRFRKYSFTNHITWWSGAVLSEIKTFYGLSLLWSTIITMRSKH